MNQESDSKMIRLLCLMVGACLMAGCHFSPDRPTVVTSLGVVEGAFRNGAIEYRAIPYSQPLSAKNRWTSATPVQAWSGSLDAAAFGGACPQTARFELTEESLEENCLTLNVSVPTNASSKERLPVLVWLPGGGFVGGGSNLYRLDKLAREGRILVVSVNYRVGALGFMSHPSQKDQPWNGNVGLEDQRLALKWVQQHIAQFGGDPQRVTLGGESAGAASVCLHLLSGDQARGLFHQAMAASYGCLYPWPTVASSLAYDASTTVDFFKPTWQLMAEKTACFDPSQPGSANELECMRAKPLKQILQAQEAVAASKPVFPFGPKIDNGPNGTVPLPGYSNALLAEHFNRVPLLYGGTQDELRLYVAYDVLGPPKLIKDPGRITPQELKAYFGIYYGLDPQRPLGSPQAWSDADYQKIIDEYFPGRDATAAEVGSIFSDYIPVAGLNNCAALAAGSKFSQWSPTVFQWEFADPDAPVLGVGIARGKDPGMALGAVHSSELNYLFPNLSNTSAINAPDLPPKSQWLANTFVQAVAEFVRSGNPNTPGIPPWSAYRSEAPDRVMRFSNDVIASYNARARHRCAFWEELDPKLKMAH